MLALRFIKHPSRNQYNQAGQTGAAKKYIAENAFLYSQALQGRWLIKIAFLKVYSISYIQQSSLPNFIQRA
jgi:hypothetical protein